MLNTCFGAAYSAGLVAIGVLMYMYHKFLMVLHQDNVGLFFPIVLHECCRPIIYLRAWSCMFIHFILFPSPQLCTTLYSNIGLPISTENRRPNWLPLILFKCSPLAFAEAWGSPSTLAPSAHPTSTWVQGRWRISKEAGPSWPMATSSWTLPSRHLPEIDTPRFFLCGRAWAWMGERSLDICWMGSEWFFFVESVESGVGYRMMDSRIDF